MFRPLDLPWRFRAHALRECGVHISLFFGALSSWCSVQIQFLATLGSHTSPRILVASHSVSAYFLELACHNTRSLLQTENTEKGESSPATISYMAISDLSVQETMGSPSFREKWPREADNGT